MTGTAGKRSAAARQLAFLRAVASLCAAIAVAAMPVRAEAEAAAAPAAQPAVVAATVALTGSTFDISGESLAGVEIRLHRASPDGEMILREARSDERGRFRVGDLQPGIYSITAVKGGYAVLIGQVNTILHSTLELILRPSGRPGRPGTRPESAAWVLRLPTRDALEDRAAQVPLPVEHDDGLADHRLSLPLTLELTASLRDDGADAGAESSPGVNAAIESTLEIADAGFLSLSFSHRDEGQERVSLERRDRFEARFAPRPGVDSFPLSLTVEADRERRDREGLEVQADAVAVRAGWAASGADGSFGASLDAALVGGSQLLGSGVGDVIDQTGADSGSVTLSVGGRRSWGGTGETAYSASVRTISGARLLPGDSSTPQTSELVLLPALSRRAAGRIDAADATSTALMVENRFPSHRAGAEISTRMTVEHVSGFDDDLRATASVGGMWGLPAGMVLSVDGGVGIDSGGTAVPVWAASVAGGAARFTWEVGGSREIGAMRWPGAAPGTRRAPAMPLMTDGDGEVQRWSANAAWRVARNWPGLSVLVETFDVDGRVAADLTGDAPWVPVVDVGSCSGAVVDLKIDNTASGTVVGIGWSEVNDESGSRQLLSGAERWTWRTITVRQRLGSGEWSGASWNLVLGLEKGETDAPDATADGSGRLTLLTQKRVSGGVALAF